MAPAAGAPVRAPAAAPLLSCARKFPGSGAPKAAHSVPAVLQLLKSGANCQAWESAPVSAKARSHVFWSLSQAALIQTNCRGVSSGARAATDGAGVGVGVGGSAAARAAAAAARAAHLVVGIHMQAGAAKPTAAHRATWATVGLAHCRAHSGPGLP